MMYALKKVDSVTISLMLKRYAFKIGIEEIAGNIGIYLHLAKGPNDQNLPWPCEITYSFEIKDSNGNQKPLLTGAIDSSTVDPEDKSVWQKPTEPLCEGWGEEEFTTREKLKEYTDPNGYFTVEINLVKPWRFK